MPPTLQVPSTAAIPVYPPYRDATEFQNVSNPTFDQREIAPYFQNTVDNIVRLFSDFYTYDCRSILNSSAIVPSHYRNGLCANASSQPENKSATSLHSPADAGNLIEAAALGFPLPAQVLTGVFTMLCSFVTVAGNLMVLFSFLIERSLRQATNYFIFSLAVTDVLIGLLSMNFYSLYLALGRWPLGELVCDIWLALDFTVCLASQYTVFFITVDRFCSVTIPTAYRNWRSDTKLLTMALGSWIIPVGIFFPVILGWPYFAGRERKESECYADFQANAWFTIGLTICYYWVTLIVMLFLYAEIYKVALRMQTKSEQKRQKVQTAFDKSRNSGTNSNSNAVSKKLSKKRQATDEKSSSGALGSESDQQSEDKEKKTSSERSGTEAKALLPDGSKAADCDSNYHPAKAQSQNENFDDDSSDPTSRTRSKSGSGKQRSARNEAANAAAKLAKLKNRVAGVKSRADEKKAALKNENRARKALKTITFIMGCFVACWTPYHIVVLIDSICKVTSENPDTFESVINVHINNMSYWLCYLNSPINPFCYAFVNVQFKKAFLRILRLDLRIR